MLKIIIENNEMKIVDLGSANGTYVDNQKITVQKVNSSSMILYWLETSSL